MLKTFELKNGIKVATFHLPQLRSVHIIAATKGGSLIEKPQNNGVAHFMEHLLVQGIPSFPTVEQLSQYIESLAGSYNASTDRLQVNFLLTLPSTYLEEGVKIASEVFFSPLFEEGAIARERGAVIEELQQRMDSHFYKIGVFSRDTRFVAKTPLLLDNGGSIEVVKKLERADLVEYWKQCFVPSNTYVVVTGNFDERNLVTYLERYFHQTNNLPAPKFPKLSQDNFSARGVFLRYDKELKSCYLDISFPSLSLDDPLLARLEQSLLFTILGGLRHSRLYRLLRQQRGLVYGVSAGASMYPGLGYGSISSETSLENVDEVLRLIGEELTRFVKDGPTIEELEFARNFLTNRWLMSFDHPSAISDWIESGLLWNDKIRLPEEYIEMVKEIKIHKLHQLMQNSWDFAKLNIVVQGAIEESQETQNRLADYFKEL